MVTHQTAVRLKAANFPPPVPAASQIWYDAFGVGRFVGSKGRVIILFNWETGSRIRLSANSDFWAEAVYCPTAAEIMPLLPSEYCIEVVSEGGVAVFRHTWDDTAPAESTHESMDEALALAWLKIHEKKQF